jgi:hypothetical protein
VGKSTAGCRTFISFIWQVKNFSEVDGKIQLLASIELGIARSSTEMKILYKQINLTNSRGSCLSPLLFDFLAIDRTGCLLASLNNLQVVTPIDNSIAIRMTCGGTKRFKAPIHVELHSSIYTRSFQHYDSGLTKSNCSIY